MKPPSDGRVVSYPKVKRFLEAAIRVTNRKPMIHGLLEVDVTKARARLRQHQARTGEVLSFTAFIMACLGIAVDEHKDVQAMRKGSNHLILFEDVDVLTYVEREVGGQQLILPYIVRAANHKSFLEIHREMELLSLTVSFDHNLIDGAPAARFTARLKELIESAHGLADQEAPRPAATTGASSREGVAVALG
jgi:pyruvate/2-oxoglutarate dehydrogenase complex dihydrolipoamide acyltransferase (E2) component